MDAHNDINFHRYSHTVQPLLGPKSERDQRLLELLWVAEGDAPEEDVRNGDKTTGVGYITRKTREIKPELR